MNLTEKQLLQIVTFALAGLFLLEAVRELRAIRYRAFLRAAHQHKCKKCGAVWQHDNATQLTGNRKAHLCPRCHAEQREKLTPVVQGAQNGEVRVQS